VSVGFKPALSHELAAGRANLAPMQAAPAAPAYEPETLSRADVDALAGPLVLDFGTGWCGHCQAARSMVEATLQAHARQAPGRPPVRHVRIEDGSGRQLGRSYGVRLWPTLVFLRDGVERARLVRPRAAEDVAAALQTIDPGSAA
jgi:thioredoxin 1